MRINNGFLDEEVDGVVIDLHCFERVWNPATGRHENGAPVDIPTGRWIDLRFNELKPADAAVYLSSLTRSK